MNYVAAEDIIKGLEIANDTAGSDASSIQEFNEQLTKDEEQKQLLLQVVSQHRKRCPDSRKSTVMLAEDLKL